VLFTFSRGAYLSLVAGSATVLLFGNPLVLATAGGGGLLAVAAFPTLIPDSIRARMGENPLMGSFDPGREEPTSGLDRSSALRLVIWRGALRMIADHPLQGVGVGRFTSEIPEYADYRFGPEDPRDAHNAYLLVAAEMGLPSAALLLLLFAAWGVGALRIYFRGRHPVDRRLSLVFLGTLAGVLVSCSLGSRFSDEALIGGFWILAALVGVVARLRPPRRVRGLA
jgi:O-antigen ligase